MDPIVVLSQLKGRATRAQLLRHTSRTALERAVAAGEIERVARGRYVLPALPDAAKTAAVLNGRVSHASAAEIWKMEAMFQPVVVHVTVPSNAHRKAPRLVTLHYSDDDQGWQVTTALKTVLDCARTMFFREALAIADSAVRRGLVSREELLAGAQGPAARRVALHVDGLAANPFESGLRATVIDVGLTQFKPQHQIGPYRVDLADPDLMIVLEADSFAHHGSRDALDRDCRRYDELVRLGWVVLRFSWEQVMFDAAWVGPVVADVARRQKAGRRRGGETVRNARKKPLPAGSPPRR